MQQLIIKNMLRSICTDIYSNLCVRTILRLWSLARSPPVALQLLHDRQPASPRVSFRDISGCSRITGEPALTVSPLAFDDSPGPACPSVTPCPWCWYVFRTLLIMSQFGHCWEVLFCRDSRADVTCTLCTCLIWNIPCQSIVQRGWQFYMWIYFLYCICIHNYVDQEGPSSRHLYFVSVLLTIMLCVLIV